MKRIFILIALALGLVLAPVWGSAEVKCSGTPCIDYVGSLDPLTFSGVVTFDNSANTPLTAVDGIQDSTLTSGRVTFAGTSGRLSGDADLTYNSTTNLLTTVSTVGSTNLCAVGALDTAGSVCMSSNTLTSEGTTADTSEMLLTFGEHTADATLTFTGNASGVVRAISTPTNGVLQSTHAEYRLVGTKTLTESAATSFVQIAVASGARTGGIVAYCINAADAADHQERCGSVPFAMVNKAGTETCTLGTASDVVAVSAGTLTVTWAADTTPTNGCSLQANAVSSLVQTTLNISYTVTLTGAAVSAVTPQ